MNHSLCEPGTAHAIESVNGHEDARRNGHARVLIVEDSLTQARQLRELLTRNFPDVETEHAINGKDAIDKLGLFKPSLVISDVVMPEMDGYEMCAALKANPRYEEIPVILLTSLSDPVDIIRGLNAGTDYYLTKPFEEDFFLSKVEAILDNPRGSQAAGPARWKVSFAGQEHLVQADLQQMLNLLLSTYESAVQKNKKLLALQDELQMANESLEERVEQRTAELSRANEALRIQVGERTLAEERLSRQLQHRDAVRQVDAAIAGSFDLRVTLNILLDQVTSQLHVDAASVLLLRPGSSRLEFVAGRGFRTRERVLTTHSFTNGPAGEAHRKRKIVRLDTLDDSGHPPLPDDVLTTEAFQAYMAVPLMLKGAVVGVLEIYHREPLSDDEQRDEFLETLAGQAAIAIDSALLFEALQRSNVELLDAYESTLEGWSKALDLRDKETEGHSLRVTQMTEALAKKLGIGISDLVHIRRGALLHDIGKLGVPDAILRKPGPLTPDEQEAMRLHPTYARDWLASVAFLRPALDIPYGHHEKWDGTGYPQGIKGDAIPIAARIFAVADVWDALRSDRPYRKSLSRKTCMEHICGLRGTHFDPRVLDAFVELAQELGEEIDELPNGCD